MMQLYDCCVSNHVSNKTFGRGQMGVAQYWLATQTVEKFKTWASDRRETDNWYFKTWALDIRECTEVMLSRHHFLFHYHWCCSRQESLEEHQGNINNILEKDVVQGKKASLRARLSARPSQSREAWRTKSWSYDSRCYFRNTHDKLALFQAPRILPRGSAHQSWRKHGRDLFPSNSTWSHSKLLQSSLHSSQHVSC